MTGLVVSIIFIIVSLMVNATLIMPIVLIILGPRGLNYGISNNEIMAIIMCISALVLAIAPSLTEDDDGFIDNFMAKATMQFVINFAFVMPISFCFITAENLLKNGIYVSVLQWLDFYTSTGILVTEEEMHFLYSIIGTVIWYILLIILIIRMHIKSKEIDEENQESCYTLLNNFKIEKLILDEILKEDEIGKIAVRDYYLDFDCINRIKIPLSISSVKEIDKSSGTDKVILDLVDIDDESEYANIYEKIFVYKRENDKDVIKVNFYISKEYDKYNEADIYFIICYE